MVLLAAGITWCDVLTDDRPIGWLSEAADIFRELDARRPLGSVLFWLGRAAVSRNDLDSAERAFREAVGLQEGLGDRFGWGWTLLWLGILARLRGDLDTAEAICRDVLARFEDVPHVVAAAWGELSHVIDDRDDPALAEQYARQAIELYRDLGDSWQIAMAIGARGLLPGQDRPPRRGRRRRHRSAHQPARSCRPTPTWSTPSTTPPGSCSRRVSLTSAAVLLGAVLPESARPARRTGAARTTPSSSPCSPTRTHAAAVDRGRHLAPSEAAELAQTWLQQHYDTTTSGRVDEPRT